MKKFGIVTLLACASLAACGREDDGSPTAAENAQLNNISEVLDTSADSLVVEDPALGNGEAAAQTGELPVDGGDSNVAAANGM